MAGAYITLDDRELREKLAALRHLLGDLAPVFRDMGGYLERAHDERFSRQEAPDGTLWEPLSPAYRKRKERHADKILVLEGHLRASLHYQVAPDSLLFGTDRVYGALHQFGAQAGAFGATRRGDPIPFGDIPARPFIGLSDADRQYIAETIEEHLQAAVA